MSGEELQVDPQDLHGKAAQIEALSWPSQAAQPPLISADALVIASIAVTNLQVNADGLWARQAYGQKEGERLAQTLRNVGDAYAQIDQMSGEDIGATIDGPAPTGPGATVFPQPVDIPAPSTPDAMPIPKGQLASDQGFMDVTAAEVALDSGDDGESLRAAAAMWRTNGQSLATSAQAFEVNSLDWEGEAADAAYAKFNAYRDWLVSLAESWKNLADEADRIAGEHDKARDAHQPIAEEYKRLEEQTMGKPLTAETMANLERMAELQASSEDIRTSYAAGAQTQQFEPEAPPSPVVSGTPVTAEDHRRARRAAAGSDDGRRAGGGAGGGQPGAGGQPAPEGMPQEAPVSPMSAAEQAGQAASQGAPQGGGAPGGGQGGSQGGAPSGGAPGGAPSGLPGLGKGEPKLPTDPSLRPAAASGGGGGSGGGAGGGGMPASPLQPAVGAETVAPTPVTAAGGPTTAAGGTTSGGAMAGGGMGGMAPMMGGPRGGESGEKKRDPQLSEDEEIYTEERPHTEPVIGHRARRRGGPEDSKRESQ